MLVIIACNTASAESLRYLQDSWLLQHYPERKVLGMIVPTVEVVQASGLELVALLATARTVESNKYQTELNKQVSAVSKLQQIATPELVPLIELNELSAAAEAAIKRIETQAGESTGVILGCTHYTQIKEQLREHFAEQKTIFAQDEIIPDKISQYLENHPEIESQLSKNGQRSIHLTKHRADYDLLMGQFLGGAYLQED